MSFTEPIRGTVPYTNALHRDRASVYYYDEYGGEYKLFVTSSAILDLINMYFDSSMTIIY